MQKTGMTTDVDCATAGSKKFISLCHFMLLIPYWQGSDDFSKQQ